MLRRFQEATTAHSLSYVREERQRNSPRANLPEGPGRFWTAPSSFVAHIAQAMLAPHFSARAEIASGEVCQLFLNEPLNRDCPYLIGRFIFFKQSRSFSF